MDGINSRSPLSEKTFLPISTSVRSPRMEVLLGASSLLMPRPRIVDEASTDQ